MRLSTWLACVGLLGAAVASSRPQAWQTPAAVNPQTLGPQVGARVPAFALPDQTGQPRTLESVIGPKGAILVFFRSADW